MSVLFVLVPLAILLVAVFVGFYVWSARTGQFDDLVTPAMRVLHDDPTRPMGTEVGPSEEEDPSSARSKEE